MNTINSIWNQRVALVFIVACLQFSLFGQQFIELPATTGIQLTQSEKDQLKEVAVTTLKQFKSNSQFNIIDCSFYSFNDEMGESQENLIWQNYKATAEGFGKNFLLFGRQYTEGSKGFKLWIYLGVDTESLECYSDSDRSDIEKEIDKYRTNLQEWYEYLSINDESNDFQIQYEVATLATAKLEKICCQFFGSRNDCDGTLDPQELRDEVDLKYYVIGRLQCLLYGQGNTCHDNSVSTGEGLGALTSENFKEFQSSTLRGSDHVFGVGKIHIYINDENDYTVTCNNDYESTTRNGPIQVDQGGNQNTPQIDVREYDLGRFTVVTEKDVDLHQKLKQLNNLSENTLVNSIKKIESNQSLTDNDKKSIIFSSACNYESLTDQEKFSLLNVIVTKKSTEWYEFWRWFEAKYPLFVRELYDGINSKFDFFLYQDNPANLNFSFDFLRYKMPGGAESSFLKDYCTDYLDQYVTTETNCISYGTQCVTSITALPYEVDKFLNFFSSNYQFTLLPAEGKVQVDKKVMVSEYHGNSPVTVARWHYLTKVDAFEPILIQSIDIPEFKLVPKVVPAIVLTSVEKYIKDANTINSIVVSADILSTVSLVGNIGKLRHLGKLKLIFTGLEITGQTGSLIVQYTNAVPNGPLKTKLSLIFASMEIIGAIGSANAADVVKIQEEASGAIKLLNAADNVPPEAKRGLLNTLSAIAGQGQLLKRIEQQLGSSHDVYKYIQGLGESVDAALIAKYASFSDDALGRMGAFTNATCVRLSTDLRVQNAGDYLVDLFNTKPRGIDAWKHADEAYPTKVWCN